MASATITSGHASAWLNTEGWGCLRRATFLCSSICAATPRPRVSSSRQDMYGPSVAPAGTEPPGPTMARVQTVALGPTYTGATLRAPRLTSAARRCAKSSTVALACTSRQS